MLDWLFVSPADRRLLGTSRFRGPTPWVIAIMSFSIMLIAATGLALASTAGSLSRAIETRYALEVPNGAANLDAVVASLKSAGGVTSVDAVPESEMRGTLERWLGREAESADLPVPALVNFNANAGTDVAGLNVVVIHDTPKVMTDGNWRLGMYIDERASDEQADKLGKVFGGQLGCPMEALGPLVGEVVGVERAPIDMTDDGLRHRVPAGDAMIGRPLVASTSAVRSCATYWPT